MFKKLIAVTVLGLIVVIYLVIPLFLQGEKSEQLSAWGRDYDDISSIREQAETMDEMTRIFDEGTALETEKPKFNLNDPYEIRSIVTGPTILSLSSINPKDTVYIVCGIEKAYSQEGIDGLKNFVKNGGHAIIADNGENVKALAAEFGVTIYPGKFYDESYDKNTNYTQVKAHLGVDLRSHKFIPEDEEENLYLNLEDIPEPDGVWDDDTDADGRVDEDPLEPEFAPIVDDDKDMGKVIGDNRDNDNDWEPDDGGVDFDGKKKDKIGNEEGVNEDILNDDGDFDKNGNPIEDEEFLNGLDDDGDKLVDEDIMPYRLILSAPSGLTSSGSRVIAQGSVNSYVDMNGDGKITTPKEGDPKDQLIDYISTQGNEIQLIVEVVVSPENGAPIDLTGFTEELGTVSRTRYVTTLDLTGSGEEEKPIHNMKEIPEFGSIIFIADSSIFINDLVDLDHIWYAKENDGVDNDGDGIIDEPYEIEGGIDLYPDMTPKDDNFLLDNSPDNNPDYDNARFFQEMIYYLLPEGGVLIFDESRHADNSPFLKPIYATINTVVFLTSDPIYATSLILVTILILILAVIITRDKENWVHRFDTSRFKGRQFMPESRRDKARILRKSALEKVRLGRSLSPDEFAQLSPKVVDSFIRDPQLIDLVRNEGREYSDAELQNLSQKIIAIK